MKTKILVICCFFLIGFIACKKELLTPECDGSNPTYDADIKNIIDANCTDSRCHGSGSNNGDWTSYDGLSDVINNGEFEQRILIDQDMPRGGDLSQDQLNKIQCWVDNGYPEN